MGDVFTALEFGYSGYYVYGNDTLQDEGSYGNYWSRTALSDGYAYSIFFGRKNVNPQYNYYRGLGLAVCCSVK